MNKEIFLNPEKIGIREETGRFYMTTLETHGERLHDLLPNVPFDDVVIFTPAATNNCGAKRCEVERNASIRNLIFLAYIQWEICI